MTNAAQVKFNDLKARGIISSPRRLQSMAEQVKSDNARARAYYEARGMSHYELHSNSIADSIAISRAHWPNLATVPARLMDEVNYRNRR